MQKSTFLAISIHAARVGCDSRWKLLFTRREQFQSTQPEWAATINAKYRQRNAIISIHAARVGCDINVTTLMLLIPISIHAARVGCDLIFVDKPTRNGISIHAARVGCDPFVNHSDQAADNFNPRSPSGLRLIPNPRNPNTHPISIHAARVGCDCKQKLASRRFVFISIHAARVGCDFVVIQS